MRRPLAVAAFLAAVFLLPAAPAVASPGAAHFPAGAQALRSTAPAPAPAEGQVTWAVQPADAKGPNGRAWVELSSRPGAEVTDYLAVRNLGKADATFSLKAADGYFTPKGRFNMLPSTQNSVDAGTWIAVAPTVRVAAGQQVVVPFTVTVPENATPGDHAAGIAATFTTPSTTSDGSKVGVESRVGFRVMTRVEGEVTPSLTGSVSAQSHIAANPFSPGSTTVNVDLSNTGNARLAVTGTVQVSGPFGIGSRTVDLAPVEDTLPGESRELSAEVPGLWPLFVSTTTVTLHPAAVEGQSFASAPADVVLTQSAAAIPWPQLAALAVLVAAVLALRFAARARRRRVAALLEDAREAGRREALEAGEDAALLAAAAPGNRGAHAWGLALAAAVGLALLGNPAAPAPEPNGVEIGVVIQATQSTDPSSTPTPTPTITPTAHTSGTPNPSSSATATDPGTSGTQAPPTSTTPTGPDTTPSGTATPLPGGQLPTAGSPLLVGGLMTLALLIGGAGLLMARRANASRH